MKIQINSQIDTSIKRNQVNTIYDLFKARVDMTPQDIAYTYFDQKTQQWNKTRWVDLFRSFLDVRNALSTEKLHIGDRIILAIPNGLEWIQLEQAAYYLGLIVVALPDTTSAANINHIIDDTDAKLVFIPSQTYFEAIDSHIQANHEKTKIITLHSQDNKIESINFDRWKIKDKNYPTTSLVKENKAHSSTIASIIYTSGTTGSPKGTVHTHENLLNNAFACVNNVRINQTDTLLSVTPVAHIMERIAGYYVPMIAGASVAFSKTTLNIIDDLQQTQTTLLVTTPHILDCAFQHLLKKHHFLQTTIMQFLDYQKGHNKFRLKFLFWPLIKPILSRTIKKQFLGNLRLIFCGGASLSSDTLLTAKLLNIPIIQGYGSSEAGGIVSINSQKKIPYHSENVGIPLNNTIVHIVNNELIIESNSLMKRYWNDENLTSNTIKDNKLHTGDLAFLDSSSIHLIGRKNQLIHLANGNKVSPHHMEEKLRADRLFKHVSIYGEKQDKLTLICQLCEENWVNFLSMHKRKKMLNIEEKNIDQEKLALLSRRINSLLKSLPGHRQIDFILPTFTRWNEENGLLNSQGKVRKRQVEKHYAEELKSIYKNSYIR